MPVILRFMLTLAALWLLVDSLPAEETAATLSITVEAGKHDRLQTPVKVDIAAPAARQKNARVVLKDADGKELHAQLVSSGLLANPPGESDKPAPMQLVFILPELAAGQSANFTAAISPDAPQGRPERFAWHDSPGQYADLTLAGRPVVRYMYQAYENDDAKRDLNNKPFHHVYDPTGKFFVTKGSGGQYTHHQGLFYGFTRITFEDGTKCNTWYCHHGEFEQHQKTLSETAGPVVGRHQTLIGWHDLQGKLFAEEQRELTAYGVDGGTLLEWSSRLFSKRGAITLDGDAQHAGFQFRASNEVSEKTAKQTYYLRPDGKGELGATRNPPDERMKNMPWHAMSFVLGDQRYTAAYLDHPQNPKPSENSERDYGRFGGWFSKYELKAGKPLELTYRIWLQKGETTEAAVARLSADFADPVKASVQAGE